MIWARRFVVSTFSFVLLLALVGMVESFSLYTAFSTPAKTKQWLKQSQLYQHFIDTTANQMVQQGTGSNIGVLASLMNDAPVIKQALQTALPEQLFNRSMTTFLDSNYGWLNGKTPKPEFKIDLTAAKAQFIQQVSQGAVARLQQLPACSLSQLRQLQTTGLLNDNCRPPGVSPAAEIQEVQQQISGNSNFLLNPIITADSLKLQQPSSPEPYYQRLHQLPRVYQAAQKLPYVLATLALLSALIILLAGQTRRIAWKHITKILIAASIILALGKIILDTIYSKWQGIVFNNVGNGEMQRALSDFAHRALDYIDRLNMIGGVAYIVLASLIITTLILTRCRKTRQSDCPGPTQ